MKWFRTQPRYYFITNDRLTGLMEKAPEQTLTDRVRDFVLTLEPGEHPAYMLFGAKCFVLERPIQFPSRYFSASLDFSFEEIVAATTDLVTLAPSPTWIAEARRIREEEDADWVKAYMKGDPNVRPT